MYFKRVFFFYISARKKVVVEVIDVALQAQLNSLSIAVCNQECILTDVKIKSELSVALT